MKCEHKIHVCKECGKRSNTKILKQIKIDYANKTKRKVIKLIESLDWIFHHEDGEIDMDTSMGDLINQINGIKEKD